MANVNALQNAAVASAALSPQPKQHTDSETYSKGILGPVYFTLSKLNVQGSNTAPADLHQSQYIVASDEEFIISVDIEFNASPLAKLLMCLGTTISVDFGFEGFGAAPEADVKASIVTVKDTLTYTISKKLTPEQAKLTAGLYEIGATVTVGPGTHACDQYVYGYGYIEEILLQVYPAM
ncbi:MAG TPA: hypothetical protein V6D26_27265 [Stenomitos sp.]